MTAINALLNRRWASKADFLLVKEVGVRLKSLINSSKLVLVGIPVKKNFNSSPWRFPFISTDVYVSAIKRWVVFLALSKLRHEKWFKNGQWLWQQSASMDISNNTTGDYSSLEKSCIAVLKFSQYNIARPWTARFAAKFHNFCQPNMPYFLTLMTSSSIPMVFSKLNTLKQHQNNLYLARNSSAIMGLQCSTYNPIGRKIVSW